MLSPYVLCVQTTCYDVSGLKFDYCCVSVRTFFSMTKKKSFQKPLNLTQSSDTIRDSIRCIKTSQVRMCVMLVHGIKMWKRELLNYWLAAVQLYDRSRSGDMSCNVSTCAITIRNIHHRVAIVICTYTLHCVNSNKRCGIISVP